MKTTILLNDVPVAVHDGQKWESEVPGLAAVLDALPLAQLQESLTVEIEEDDEDAS